MSKGTVLVTGGTGFLGSHVIAQLLEQGYTVRGTTRSSSSKLRAVFPNADPQRLQAVEVPSLTSDHSAIFEGINALVHVASPYAASPAEIFKGAYEGTVNIVRQAIASGVKKIVITGTMGSLINGKAIAALGTRTITEKDFIPVTLESFDMEGSDSRQAYAQAKTLADKKVWEIAHENPDVDITVILPPLITGPPITPPNPSISSLSSNMFIHRLLSSEYPALRFGYMIDVRDAARAHVLALSAPPVSGRDKRFIIVGSKFTWDEIIDLVSKERPELAGRLPEKGALEQLAPPLDTSFTEEVLGFKTYLSKEETFLAAVDVIIEWEKSFGGDWTK